MASLTVTPLSTPSLLITFFLVVFCFAWKRRSLAAVKRPPGPWKLPFIGNLHQLNRTLPHRCLRDMAATFGPFMQLQLGQISVIVVSSAEVTREILSTHDAVFSNRPLFVTTPIIYYEARDILFSPYGHHWRQLRKICNLHLFTAKRVQSFRSIREEEVSAFVSFLHSSAGIPTNLHEKVSSLIFGMTSRIAFGRRNEDRKKFKAVVDENVKTGVGFSLLDMFPSFRYLHNIGGYLTNLRRLHRESDGILQKIVDDHRRDRAEGHHEDGESREDLVHVLLKVQELGDFELEDDDIKAVIHDIFFAGSQTSSLLIEWVMAEMMDNPSTMKKAEAEVRMVFKGRESVEEDGLDELVYLKAVIKEALRLHPIAPLIPRECSETCVVNGYEIPARTRVILNAWAIGRDPRIWKDGERFDPDRFLNSSFDIKGPNFQYIPFGGGRRMCPGYTFSSVVVELVVAQLLFHFDWKLREGEEKVDMGEHCSLELRKEKPLVLVPIPRSCE